MKNETFEQIDGKGYLCLNKNLKNHVKMGMDVTKLEKVLSFE